MRLLSEGHKVRMWIQDPKYKQVGDGLVEKVDDYYSALKWCDFIITDDSGFGQLAEDLREEGHVVWGGTKNTDEWESDRSCGQEVFKKAGLTVLPHWSMDSVDAAIEFVRNNPGLYVVKPDGKGQEEKSLTYVGQLPDGSDTIAMLEHAKKFSNLISSIELQKRVVGVEVACSGFFNGNEFVEPIEVSFEHKKLMNGNLGPNTGEQGTSMYWTTKKSRLYQATIEKVVPDLRKEGYIGYYDINCIATETELYPLEPTCRFGYPTIMLKMETIDGDIGEWMFELASGVHRDFPVTNKVSICVCVSVPPFPYEDEELFNKHSKDALVHLPKDLTGVYLQGVRLQDGEYLQTLQDGSIAVCTGSGDTIEQAQSMAYTRAKSIVAPNVMYRTDIGATWHSDISRLSLWGWI